MGEEQAFVHSGHSRTGRATGSNHVLIPQPEGTAGCFRNPGEALTAGSISLHVSGWRPSPLPWESCKPTLGQGQGQAGSPVEQVPWGQRSLGCHGIRLVHSQRLAL